MKRNGNGKTVHTVAEPIRPLTNKEIKTLFPTAWDMGGFQRVRVNNHERLLYWFKASPMFSFPRPYPPEPPYVTMRQYMHRISVASCGVDLWPKGFQT